MPLKIRGDRVAQDSLAPEEGIYPVRGKGCEGKRRKEAHRHHSCGMINPQLTNIKQVQLVDNAMTVLGLIASWQFRVFMRPINMQKYMWDGKELNTGLYSQMTM